MALRVVPITRAEANAFVAAYHRHHKPVHAAVFQVGVADVREHRVVGVAIVGEPVSRMLAREVLTLEVLRCCTNGTRNACSMLYRAAWRAARALGYTKLITYTLPEEGGASLRGAGFKVVAETRGGSWSRPSRPRVDTAPLQGKLRWELMEPGRST